MRRVLHSRALPTAPVVAMIVLMTSLLANTLAPRSRVVFGGRSHRLGPRPQGYRAFCRSATDP